MRADAFIVDLFSYFVKFVKTAPSPRRPDPRGATLRAAAIPVTTVADIGAPAGDNAVDFLALLTCSRSLARGAVHARGER
jgi:hypothetical protein